jgi:hypothetical protein
VRALLATAGLLVLAGVGSAAAGQPTAHTLRKSPTGPIEAIAQDGNLVAWFTSSTRACDEVHVLSPGKRDRNLPQPSSGGMTCHWDLQDGQPQVAVAARMSTALWTLHESGPAPFDYVVAANFGGPERRVDRLAHASTGTGLWLGGVAGTNRTLAYSYVDVEYVDPLACLSGGSCVQKIAGGGIQLVSRTSKALLPGAAPALALAAAAGRLAYIPATTVDKTGEPTASPGESISVVDAVSGTPVSQVAPKGLPLAIALSRHILAVLTQNARSDRLSWYDPAVGTKLGSVPIPRRAAPQLAASDQLLVYRVGRLLRGVATLNGHGRILAKTAPDSVGMSLVNGRLIWAEDRNDGTGRLRALAVG